MGLFGYGEKDFAKNTDRFKSEINDIMEYSDPATRRVLNNICFVLDKGKFKGGKKNYENIDGVIDGVLKKMTSDAHDRKTGSLFERAKQLSGLVERNRLHGEISYTRESLEQNDKMATLLGVMVDLLNKQEEMTERQSEILQEAEGLSKESAQRSKLQVEYNRLNILVEKNKSTVFEYQRRYNVASKALAEIEEHADIIQLSDLAPVSPKELSAVLESTSKTIAQMHDIDDSMEQMIDDANAERHNYAGGVQMEDAFSVEMQQKEAQKMSESLNGATVSGRPEEDAFSKAMNKR